MNIQHMLLEIIVAVLLVTSSYAAPLNGNDTTVAINSNFSTPVTNASNVTNPVTTLVTTSSTQTTAPFTTARATTAQDTSAATLITSAGTSPTPSVTSGATSGSSTPSTSTKTVAPTTKASGRKFDGLSFFGGMILAGGLAGILFLIVSYLRRNNQLPYSNIR